MISISEQFRPKVSKSPDLLSYAPHSLDELASWFAVLSPAQFDSVWVAAIIAIIAESDTGEVHPAEILPALDTVRRRYRNEAPAILAAPSPPVPDFSAFLAPPTRRTIQHEPPRTASVVPPSGGATFRRTLTRAQKMSLKWKRRVMAMLVNVGDRCPVGTIVTGRTFDRAVEWAKDNPRVFSVEWCKRGKGRARIEIVRTSPDFPPDYHPDL